MAIPCSTRAFVKRLIPAGVVFLCGASVYLNASCTAADHATLGGVASTTNAVQAASTRPPHDSNPKNILLLDDLGRLVKVPTNEMPAGLRPPPGINPEHQLPMPIGGTKSPPEIRDRIEQSRQGLEGIQLFPAVPPPLMPYLASQDQFGNTAARPGPLIPIAPLEPMVQKVKYQASEIGLRYSLQQTCTFVGMSDVLQGENSLGFYTLDFKSKWAVFDAPDAGTAGWLSARLDAKTGLGSAGQTQDARRNLGSLTDPTSIWSKVNGLRIPELAWQQSLNHGEVVVVAGMVDQGNYLDANEYADTGRGEFLNSALIDTMVMPLPSCNFGLNLQWQPHKNWYAMFGASAGNAAAGQAPWTDFNWSNWTLLWEVGYAPDDVLGLGPGIYRIQPFIAQVDRTTVTTYSYSSAGTTNSVSVTNNWFEAQGGICLNFQQQLGHNSPFGWFGRFGIGGQHASASASAQVGTGFVLHAPLKDTDLIPRLDNDLLGVGFIWSQPAATSQTVYHKNEYVLETFYTLQLSPMMRLQPDLQVVWDPIHNPNNGAILVGQLQFILTW